MAKRTYTAEEKARVLATLQGNGGNVKRTARDTGVAEQTVRDWKKQAERGATAPAVKAALPAAQTSVTDDWERVRDKALLYVEQAIDGGALSSRDAVTIFGILTDKIRLVRGEATQRTETVSQGPSPEELGRAIGAALEGAFGALATRQSTIRAIEDGEVVDVDGVEEQAGHVPAALPSPS